ncbi:MAG: kelch repeat-containing protein [Verrucomicrobiota bacterium]
MKTRIARTILNRRMIWLAAVLACCLCHNLPLALAAPGSWTLKAPMPMALDAHASCAVDGILYVIGGHKDPGIYTQLPTLFAYDPKTDSWTSKKDMPTARRWPAASVVDGIIYVIGGGCMFSPALDTVEAYDPKTDTWMTKAHLPAARSSVAACAVDGIIYAIGGLVGTISAGNMQRSATVEAYDPKTNHWTPKASLPEASAFHTANAVNGIIYVFFKKQTFAYDPQTNRWTYKAPIPTWSLNSLFTASSVVDGIAYLFGGSSDDGWTTYDLTLAYDPVQDKFTAKRRMPVTCEAAACATIAGKIYHSGGVNQDPIVRPAGAVYYDTLWVFDSQGGVTPQLLSLNRESPDRVRLAWQGEAGRLYGVQSTLNPVKGPWTRLNLPLTNTILATNELVEATCPVPSADTNRFFRVLEAN